MNLSNWQQLVVYLAVLGVATALALTHVIDSSFVIAALSAILGGNLFAHGLTSSAPSTPTTPAAPATPSAAPPPVVG